MNPSEKKLLNFWFIALLLGPFSTYAGQIPDFPDNLQVSFNGTFIPRPCDDDFKNCSRNSVYRCRYDIGNVNDEIRELKNFHLYENGFLLYTLKETPGSDLLISDQGTVVFFDMKYHFLKEVSLNFYSRKGDYLFSYRCKGRSLFGFSPDGRLFLAGNPSVFSVINLLTGNVTNITGGENFAFSEDSNLLVVESGGIIHLFSDLKETRTLQTGLTFIRKIGICTDNDLLALIDKHHLQVYSLNTKELRFVEKLEGNYSYRDLLILNGTIFAGIHYRYNGESTGILRIYDTRGILLSDRKEKTTYFPVFPNQGEQLKTIQASYTPISWPFQPFNEVHTVWNHYEQHMGDGTPYFSYLHQGLDIIAPVNEPIYAVEAGWVKCVLTTGGDQYWRIAISPVQVTGYSDGWLYAHLVESSIQFTVGDYVNLHDYLGNIIYWSSNWGHTHFVNIHDHGQIWSYYDDEWGINFNPLLALDPITDSIAPVIEPVFSYSKFAFCTNETSNYLNPSDLYGDIDIIVKVSDYMGASLWEQPGYKTFYWVKRIAGNTLVSDTTLGQVLNHSYLFYSATQYEPYAPLIYKTDSYFPAPNWMDYGRDFYQILTNNNGDTILNLSEVNNSFHTTDYPDGNYRIFVEVFDETGNNTLDSMDVVFNNGINAIDDVSPSEEIICKISPNPFSGSAFIEFILPPGFHAHVRLSICNSMMAVIQVPLNEMLYEGRYQAVIRSESMQEGIYYAILESESFRKVQKLVVLKQ